MKHGQLAEIYLLKLEAAVRAAKDIARLERGLKLKQKIGRAHV